MKNKPNRSAMLASLALLALACPALGQSPVPIVNPGFEDPVLEDGIFQNSAPGWTVIGTATTIGVLNPTVADYPGGAPEGANVAMIDGTVGEAGLGQVLNTSLVANAEYTLTAEVGNTNFYAAGFPGYRVQLLAGGDVLAEDNDTLLPPLGTFVTSTISYTYNAALHAALVGEPLEIRLLGKGLDGTEVDFDDVRLTVSLTDPFADSGGPYTVAVGASLSLEADASLPSDGQTITSYEWDLNNNNDFSDATGATPATISFLDLQSLYGMSLGSNTIQLRVTDSSAKTAVVSTTVDLVLAVAAPGFNFFVDAAEADDASEYWNDLVAGNPTGFGLRVDKSAGNEVTRQAISGSNTQLTHAFQLPGGRINNVGGALLVNSNTTTTRSFGNIGWNTQPVSFEIWFKPDTLTPTPANGQILFEDGGGTGLGLFLSSAGLQTRKAGGGGIVTYNIATDPSNLLLGPATEEFIQAVFTYNTATGVLQLFVNGTFVGSANPGGNNWTGGDAAAFGTRGGNNVGGIGGGQQNTESFSGQIASIRAYRNRILTADEIENNFLALSGPDVTPPEIASLSPQDGATGLYPGISLTAIFDENIAPTGSGTITLKNLTAATDQVITLPDSQVSVSGSQLIIEPAANLAFDSTYAVRISADAIQDPSGNLFGGIDDDTTWSFSTAAQNLNPPVIVVKSPQDASDGAGIGTNIVATFDQSLLLGSGNIIIKDLVDDSTTQTIDVTDSAQVMLVGNVMTINPAGVLASATEYAVRIPATAARNFSEVNIAGIADDTEWTFTTSNLTSHLSILDLVANGNINPATSEPWKHGDRHRLVFISSEGLTPRDDTAPSSFGSWNSIDTWNAEAQRLANNAVGHELGGATWKVVGSTLAVNARDNTRTNPTVHGTGHPIMLIDGKTIVARDFNELWGPTGHQIRNVIDLTENKVEGANQTIGEAPAIPWPFTGTNISGTVISGGHLRSITGTQAIRQGQGDNLRGWIDRANFTVAAQSSGAMAIYVMSDELFVYNADDVTAPNLVSIVDNVSGGPVAVDAPVVYTVTFNEFMLPSTLTAADFSNAGSAVIEIGTISEVALSTYTVEVTPTTVGTLQLRINQGAVVTDLAGNALDTSAALTDDTIITVSEEAGYASWAGGFTGLTNTDPTLDFDGGGLATGIEWVVGGDPTDPSDDAALAPTFDNTSDPDFFIFTYRRTEAAAADANTTIAVEYGSNLTDWTTAEDGPNIVISVNEDGAGTGVDLVEVKIRRSLVDGKLFARLQVAVAAP